VGELVGVDDRVDVGDLPVGDVEGDDADESLLGVEVERSGAAVDLDGAPGYAG
jgi:hypothetical protein